MGLRLAKITRRAEMGPSELTLVSIPFTTNGDARRLNKLRPLVFIREGRRPESNRIVTLPESFKNK